MLTGRNRRPWRREPREIEWDPIAGPRRSDLEESLNALTHAIGFVISLIAAYTLLQPLWSQDRGLVLASVVAYCLALSSVYMASTLSHWIRSAAARRRLRAWDQGLIYLLIVATYTPLSLIHLRGAWHGLTIAMWLVAAGGFLSKVAMTHRVEAISLWLYLILGWLPALALPALLSAAPWQVVTLVLAGGIAYTGGAVLLAYDYRYDFLHTGWHLCVMIGSWCHYGAIYLSIMLTMKPTLALSSLAESPWG